MSRPLHHLCLAGTLGLGACTVVHPTGWNLTESSEPMRLTATPGVMYGWAPLSYDLPDGRRIRVEVDRIRRAINGATNVRFSLGFEGEPRQLHCATEPTGPGLESSRFGCWDAKGTTTLSIAPECASRNPGVAMRDARCWEGHLTRQGERIELRRAHFARSGVPVGRIAWVGDHGPLLAANIQVDLRMDLWVSEPTEPALHDDLILFTVAIAWWEHAATSD